MTIRTHRGEEHLAYAPELSDDRVSVPADPWVEAGGPEHGTDEDGE